MSAIVKEYSCTPMEPIRIHRRLVQSSSLPLPPLPFLSPMVDRMLEERQEMVGWSSNIPFVRPFLPLFGRWFPIYKTSLLYEAQPICAHESANIISTTCAPRNLAEVRMYSSRMAAPRPSTRHAASCRESCRSRGNNIERPVSASIVSAR